MELKQIQVDKILANFYQPRVKFEKEGIKELAESILSNGLINPITVRKWKDKFMVVAGERRWRAHKVAGLKKIDAFVKEYKSDVDWQVESLVENWQREDLTSTERENNVYALWKTGVFTTYRELEKRIGAQKDTIHPIIEAKKFRDKTGAASVIKTRNITDTRGLENEDREKLLKQVEIGKIRADNVREYTKAVKKAPEEVKEALLSDEISVEQAERISKLKTEQQREKAIQEHKNIALVEKGVERHIEKEPTTREKRERDKKLIQANNWVLSFKNSVTDAYSQIAKTLKILLVSTKLISIMDDKQKEKLDIQLNRFTEVLERGLHISEQIQDKI